VALAAVAARELAAGDAAASAAGYETSLALLALAEVGLHPELLDESQSAGLRRTLEEGLVAARRRL
jgi:hypothetical protein